MSTQLSLKLLIFSLFMMGECGISFLNVIPALAVPNAITEDTIAGNQEDKRCSSFVAITNLIKADGTPSDLPSPTRFCASDLMGVQSALEITQTDSETPVILEEDQPSSPIEETPLTKNNNSWRFTLQPYATIPVTTYGTATVRGRNVDYHLSLGETLQRLRVTASGRFEGWKGRWGFIVDGYYVSLTGIADFQKSAQRIPNTINALNFLLSKDVNTKVQNLATILNQDVTQLENIQALRESEQVQTLKQNIQTFQERIAQDAQTLRELEQDLQAFQAEINQQESQLQTVDFELQQSESIDLDEKEVEEVVTLSNQSTQESFNERIETAIMRLESLDSLQQQLTETRTSLEQVSQEISELRAIEDSPELQQLEADVENAKVILDRDIETLQQIESFAENRDPQTFDANLSTDLQFDQGIYDFALSYHIGELPLRELPKTPSNRSYPLLWFQPIAGVRLNDIDIEIQQTIDLSLSNSLVNFQGTYEETLKGGRTWFEPMLGGKVGLQISDPITFWVRGDVSGFGLAGEKDLSWNVFFGVDWWIRRQLSLQFAYHFYHIDYQIGQGNNAFGFTQNLNGPYLSATFHF